MLARSAFFIDLLKVVAAREKILKLQSVMYVKFKRNLIFSRGNIMSPNNSLFRVEAHID